MEGDFHELSQFLYNSYQFPYNFYLSPLGTTRFLTSGIRVVDLEIDEYDRQEILKDLKQMVDEVSEKVKAFAKSKKAMKEELLRLQQDLENMTEDELQSFDLMELEEQIKFQESNTVVASQDVDFFVKVDDDILVHAALEVQSKEPIKKIMTIQESAMHEVVVVGVDTRDPMVLDCGQTHTSTYGAAHIVKNEDMKLTITNIGGNANEFELDDSFLGGCGGINDGFHNRVDHNFYKDLGVSWDLKGCEDIEIALKKLSISPILAS